MKRILIFSIAAITVSLAALFLPTPGEASVSRKIMRFHVIANSDSEFDQSLKEKVKNDALEYFTSTGLDDFSSLDEAKESFSSALGDIISLCQESVSDEGCNYPVSASVTEEYFPTKDYGSFRLPAGKYLSLKIVIGEGKGHNFWCVLYPPLCLSSAKPADGLSAAGFTPEEVKLITDDDSPRVKIKFRFVEIINDIWRRLFG